jgi:hypothetical protein
MREGAGKDVLEARMAIRIGSHLQRSAEEFAFSRLIGGAEIVNDEFNAEAGVGSAVQRATDGCCRGAGAALPP